MHLPEEYLDCLDECLEIVVPMNLWIGIESNFTKHLQLTILFY